MIGGAAARDLPSARAPVPALLVRRVLGDEALTLKGLLEPLNDDLGGGYLLALDGLLGLLDGGRDHLRSPGHRGGCLGARGDLPKREGGDRER